MKQKKQSQKEKYYEIKRDKSGEIKIRNKVKIRQKEENQEEKNTVKENMNIKTNKKNKIKRRRESKFHNLRSSNWHKSQRNKQEKKNIFSCFYFISCVLVFCFGFKIRFSYFILFFLFYFTPFFVFCCGNKSRRNFI